MKEAIMILTIVVSLTSAQGMMAQDEIAELIDFEYEEYDEQQEYTKIEIVQLPMPIQEAAARDFEKMRIFEAYISKDNTYKIILKDNQENIKIIFANANGEWIKPNDKS